MSYEHSLANQAGLSTAEEEAVNEFIVLLDTDCAQFGLSTEKMTLLVEALVKVQKVVGYGASPLEALLAEDLEWSNEIDRAMDEAKNKDQPFFRITGTITETE